METKGRLALVAALVAILVALAGLAVSPDGRVFFAERFSGRIQVLGNTTILDSTFFAIPEIASSGEQGLLGLAVDPNFPNRPYVYVYYTRDDVANGTVYNRIVRIRSSGSIGIGMDVLRDRSVASTIHNAGVIEFGPDGKLYALVGDAANSASAQDLSGPNGKVLRINPDGTVPSDNPFVGRPGADADVYTFGHRNMFGIAWSPGTHAGYVSENGPQDSDEINLLIPGGNYGWPNVRGIARTPTFLATAPDGILEVEMGLDGTLWLTTPSGIYRLAPVPVNSTPMAGSGIIGWMGLVSTVVAGHPWRRPLLSRGSERTPPRKP